MINARRIVGIVLCAAGIILIFVSLYIKEQVAQGKIQISEGESKVGAAKGLFGLNPYTKEAGQQLFVNPGEEKIKAGKSEIAYYAARANQIMTVGIICIAIGIVLIVIPVSNKRGMKW